MAVNEEVERSTIPQILSVFLGVAIAISLASLLRLPLLPWLTASTLLILIVLLLTIYFTLNYLPSDSFSFGFTEMLKISSIALVTFLPFSLQKVFFNSENLDASSSIEGPQNLPHWGFAIHLLLTGIVLIILGCKEKNKTKFWLIPLIMGIVFLLGSLPLFWWKFNG